MYKRQWEERVGASNGRKVALALTAVGPAMGRKGVGVTARDGFYERP